MSPAPKPGTRRLARYGLGLWFCGVGALGLLQFYLRAFDDGVFQPGAIAWLWLAGAVVVVVIGVAAIVHAARHRPGP